MVQHASDDCKQRMMTFRAAHPEHASIDTEGFTLTLDGWKIFLQESPTCTPADLAPVLARSGSSTPSSTSTHTPTPTRSPAPTPRPTSSGQNPFYRTFQPTGRLVSFPTYGPVFRQTPPPTPTPPIPQGTTWYPPADEPFVPPESWYAIEPAVISTLAPSPPPPPSPDDAFWKVGLAALIAGLIGYSLK